MAAARHAFATQGYSGATMRRIAADAGVTAMALYNHAPSKAELFATVWHDSIETVYAGYAAAVDGHASLVEELDAVLDHSRDVLAHRPDHLRFVVRVLVERDHDGLADVTLRVPTVGDFFAGLTGRAVRRGEIAEHERERLVTSVATLLWGLTTLTAFDTATLDGAIDAARWAVRRQFPCAVS